MVDFYDRAAKEPGGLLCINPEEPPEERLYFDANDPSEALGLLEQFAKHGTFEPIGIDNASLLALHIEFDEMRSAGITYEVAVAKLADQRHVDARTIERWLTRPIGDLCIMRGFVAQTLHLQLVGSGHE